MILTRLHDAAKMTHPFHPTARMPAPGAECERSRSAPVFTGLKVTGINAYDVPIRWGGEEFVIISENTSDAALYAMAQRLRMLIAASSVPHDDLRLNITVSMGCAIVRPEDDADSIMTRADQRLFTSKQEGRNRVTI